MTHRWDETWHRLRVWTNGQAQSERLAAQILMNAGYEALDPSHPLGGKDGGKDAVATRDGIRWVMAVHFPRGQKGFRTTTEKFMHDLSGVARNSAGGFAFVTNQELTLGQRETLRRKAKLGSLDLFHLERITSILDAPAMHSVRRQFLGIEPAEDAVTALKSDIASVQDRVVGYQTGGHSFCYWMLYHFDIAANIARNFVVIRRGEYPLYDVRLRIRDMDASSDVLNTTWGEINAPADFKLVRWSLPPSIYYRIFFHARNGSWNQDLILKKSIRAACWLAAARVRDKRGASVVFEHTDNEFIPEFGSPTWRE